MRQVLSTPLAVVMGDIDLVRPLALAGVRSALFAKRGDPAALSRHVVTRIKWRDHWRDQEGVADELLAFARSQEARPLLMPQTDGDLVAVSRQRERLREAFHFTLAEPELVESLVDKGRFAELARNLGLPVPPSRRFDPARDAARDIDLRFPLILKPLVRDHARWSGFEASAKAVAVPTPEALSEMWPRLAELGLDFLVQEMVAGSEASIESHHAYMGQDGALIAEFTGRKIRTRPRRFGHTTALQITAEDDVSGLGREILTALGLRGVAKVDFKRGRDGRLALLEVNPRFNLWHHPGAIAGVNLPALVHADLAGRPRPPIGPIRAGVTWCLPLGDLRAARSDNVGLFPWLRFLRRCEARSGMSLDDPLPFIPGLLWMPLVRRLRA